jgi:hypothetical protein
MGSRGLRLGIAATLVIAAFLTGWQLGAPEVALPETATRSTVDLASQRAPLASQTLELTRREEWIAWRQTVVGMMP